MMKKYLILALATVISAAAAAQSSNYDNDTTLMVVPMQLPSRATGNGSLSLTLDECIQIAISDNPTIKVAQMEIQRVDYSRKQTVAQLLPNVNFQASYQRSLAIQTVYMGDQSFKMGRDNTYDLGFSATVPIIAPQLWKSIKLNDNQILQNIEAARKSKLSLENQVRNTYYALLLAMDSKNVIEENHQTAIFNAKVFKRKYELGTASEYDMLRANVAVSNLEPSIMEAENSISQLKLQLKVLMGMDLSIDIEPSQTLDDFRASLYERALILDTSLVDNSDLKTLDLQTDLLDKTIDLRKAAFYPTLSGSINYMWNSTSMGSPFKNFKWNPHSAAGLTLSVPLFSGGQRYYAYKQSEIQRREMDWQRDNLTRQLSAQVDAQIDNLQRNLKQIEANSLGVSQAVKANEIMQKTFQIGSGTFIQLLDTQDALMASRLSYYQAVYNFLVAESDLKYLLGREN